MAGSNPAAAGSIPAEPIFSFENELPKTFINIYVVALL
jgi:hypothetical protein